MKDIDRIIKEIAKINEGLKEKNFSFSATIFDNNFSGYIPRDLTLNSSLNDYDTYKKKGSNLTFFIKLNESQIVERKKQILKDELKKLDKQCPTISN